MEKSRSCMLLGTRCSQVGSDGKISIAHASRNPTLLSGQRWKNLDRGCSRNGETFNLHTWMLLLFDCPTPNAVSGDEARAPEEIVAKQLPMSLCCTEMYIYINMYMHIYMRYIMFLALIWQIWGHNLGNFLKAPRLAQSTDSS